MVGAKKKKKRSDSMPQLRVGGIYHSTIFGDRGRSGHFVVISDIISTTEIRVHVCTSSEYLASRGSIEAYGLLGPSMTYILTKAEIVHPSKIGACRHLMIPREYAEQLGISL